MKKPLRMMKYFTGEKEKWTNKENDKHGDAYSYTIQVVNVCTKF